MGNACSKGQRKTRKYNSDTGLWVESSLFFIEMLHIRKYFEDKAKHSYPKLQLKKKINPH